MASALLEDQTPGHDNQLILSAVIAFYPRFIGKMNMLANLTSEQQKMGLILVFSGLGFVLAALLSMSKVGPVVMLVIGLALMAVGLFLILRQWME